MTIPSRLTAGAFDLSVLKKPAPKPASGPTSDAPLDDAVRVAPFAQLTEETFEAEVARRSIQVPVIVLIGTPRSEQSEQLKADFAELAVAGALSFVVRYVDADTHPQVAQVFGVRNLPTVVAIAAGQPITHFEGGQPREALEQWISAIVQQVGPQLEGLQEGTVAAEAGEAAPEEQMDPRVLVAEDALNRGDFAAAIAAYEEILASDPGAADIKQARDTTRLLQRIQDVDDPISAAETDSSPAAQMAAADAEVVAGVPEKAFDRLISAMRVAPEADKKLLRERLLELFGLFEPSDPRVLSARTQLASALY